MPVTTSSSRLRFQTYIESLLGCIDTPKWPNYQSKLEKYTLSVEETQEAKECLAEDAGDLYYKACLSLCNALNSLYRGLQSWPVINLYYSTFYSMRAHLAALNVGIIRSKGIFLWRAAAGSVPRRLRPKDRANDHTCILQAFKTIVANDVLQTNHVNGDSVYDWLFAQRNRIQYRDRSFCEPEQNDYFHPNIFRRESFDAQITAYIQDSVAVYCFIEEHSLIATSIRRLSDSKAVLRDAGLPDPLLDRQVTVRRMIDEITQGSTSEIYRLLEY